MFISFLYGSLDHHKIYKSTVMGCVHMKIGIAITLYDKFEELKLLVDIIRHNWKEKYIITVCSNHPDAAKHMKDIDVDAWVQGEDIKYSPKLPYIRASINITCRILDGIKKSCTAANNLGVDYVMHLHTDAWALKEEEVVKLAEHMKRNKIRFAGRGMGLGKARPDCPLGHLDDMFFMYDVRFIEERKFFDYNPLELLPDRLTIHGVLSLLIVGRIGLSNFYLYENHTSQVFWDGKHADPHFERGKPMMFDPEKGFLHIHSQSFPGDLSKNLQAYYLKKYGLTKGKAIEAFVARFSLADRVLFRRLNRLEQKLDNDLRKQGYFLSIGRFGRDFNKKLEYIHMPLGKKLRFLFVNSSRALWTEIFGKRRLRAGKYYGLELYPEISVWPRYLGAFYAENLEASDYPNKEDVWFLKNKQV